MIVLTALLTANPDPQRPRARWKCDPDVVDVLARSVEERGHELVVFHDESPTRSPRRGEWVRVRVQHPNPYFARWFIYRDHLTGVTGQAWCVDGSDVELLRTPDTVELACGSEPSTVAGQPWMAQHHPTTRLLDQNTRLLNAGILGGKVESVRQIAADIAAEANAVDLTDMAVFNHVLRRHRPLYGKPVHTVYKAFDMTNRRAWWRHK